MVQDAASSHLHIVSCYEDGEDDSNSEIIMKSPLIITTLEAEEQTLLENDKQHGKWLSGRGDLLFVWVHNGNFVAPALLIGAVPLMRLLLMTAVVHFILFWILIKCLDWGRNGSGENERRSRRMTIFLFCSNS
jgi:hypothetical protein